MSAKIVDRPHAGKISIKQMKIGEIGTFMYGSDEVIALRTYNGIVNLADPGQTWSLETGNREGIQLLPVGTKIEVVAE